MNCTSAHLAALGCAPDLHAEMEAFGTPTRFLTDMYGYAIGLGKRVSFLALLAFLRKYSPIVPAIFAAYASGGWLGVLMYVTTIQAQYPDILKDFEAIFV